MVAIAGGGYRAEAPALLRGLKPLLLWVTCSRALHLEAVYRALRRGGDSEKAHRHGRGPRGSEFLEFKRSDLAAQSCATSEEQRRWPMSNPVAMTAVEEMLRHAVLTLDDLVQRTGLCPVEVVAALEDLVEQGRVVAVGNGGFRAA